MVVTLYLTPNARTQAWNKIAATDAHGSVATEYDHCRMSRKGLAGLVRIEAIRLEHCRFFCPSDKSGSPGSVRVVAQPEVGQANRGCGHENGDTGQVDCWVQFRSVNMANCRRPYRPCSQHACPNIDFRDQRVVDGAFLGDLLQL